MMSQALGTPLVENRSVKSVMSDMLKYQGIIVEGESKDIWPEAAERVVEMVSESKRESSNILNSRSRAKPDNSSTEIIERKDREIEELRKKVDDRDKDIEKVRILAEERDKMKDIDMEDLKRKKDREIEMIKNQVIELQKKLKQMPSPRNDQSSKVYPI